MNNFLLHKKLSDLVNTLGYIKINEKLIKKLNIINNKYDLLLNEKITKDTVSELRVYEKQEEKLYKEYQQIYAKLIQDVVKQLKPSDYDLLKSV